MQKKIEPLYKHLVFSTDLPFEEKLNAGTHFLGFIFGIFALALMSLEALERGSAIYGFSTTAFAFSATTLYFASTLYHLSVDAGIKRKLKIVDHSSKFLLNAGTYTPVVLLVLNGSSQ